MVGGIVIAGAGFQRSVPLDELFLDPAHITGAPWYTGALSNLGILIWTTGIAMAAAGAWVARRTNRPAAAEFLLIGAIATLVLLVDDVFQFHSGLLKRSLGVPKQIAQLAVVLPAIVWIIKYRDDILRTRSALLAAALGSFVVSLGVDAGLGLSGDAALLMEDGAKFLGILAWAQYFAITARDIARSTIDAAMKPTPWVSGSDAEGENRPVPVSVVASSRDALPDTAF